MCRSEETVFIVDTGTHGHHLTYIVMIAETFLATGNKVVVICPPCEKLREVINEPRLESVVYLEWTTDGGPTLLTKLLGKQLQRLFRVQLLIKTWAKKHGLLQKDVRVFFPCMESFTIYQRWQVLLFQMFGLYLYSGIVIGAGVKEEGNDFPRFFQSRQIRSVHFLNELLVDQWSQSNIKKARWIPDVSPTHLPSHTPEICREIMEFAGGRKILLVYGFLSARKMVAEFISIFDRNACPLVCLTLVGTLNKTSIGPETAKTVTEIERDGHENIFVHNAYIKKEEDLNAIVRQADFVSACYPNYPYSSNVLFKAVSFSKSVITADDGVIGARARNYHIGVRLPECDEDQLERAIQKIAENDPDDYQFDEFLEAHNREMFAYCLAHAYDDLLLV